MSKYAVIKLNGNQYQVTEGEELLAGKLDKDKLGLDVLLYVQDKKVELGKPVLKNIDVEIKVVKDEEKGEKVTVFKYKAKSRYRKKTGFRPQYTRLLIEKISAR